MGCATSIPARTDSTAERRVDQVIAQAKDNISRARRTGVILGFMLGAAALLGAAAAWYVAIATGRYRDRGEIASPTLGLGSAGVRLTGTVPYCFAFDSIGQGNIVERAELSMRLFGIGK